MDENHFLLLVSDNNFNTIQGEFLFRIFSKTTA